jgi:hypothetical protein
MLTLRCPDRPLLRNAVRNIGQFLTDSAHGWQLMRAQYRQWRRPQRDAGIKLLKEWLSAEQLVQFNKYEYFEVTGCQSGKRYRIGHGIATNIHELDQYGRPKAVGVLSQTSHSSPAMSCSYKKLLWRPTSGVRWRWLNRSGRPGIEHQMRIQACA